MVDESCAPRMRARIRRAGVGQTAVATVAGAFAIASQLAGCSLLLDFGEPMDVSSDAPIATASCIAFEPNDTPESATSVGSGDFAAAICGSGDHDYFRFTVDGAQSLLARITFMNRNGAGDIDLRLLSLDGSTVINESRTSADVEEVVCPATSACMTGLAAGDYLLHVVGFNAAVQSEYTLHLEFAAAGAK